MVTNDLNSMISHPLTKDNTNINNLLFNRTPLLGSHILPEKPKRAHSYAPMCSYSNTNNTNLPANNNNNNEIVHRFESDSCFTPSAPSTFDPTGMPLFPTSFTTEKRNKNAVLSQTVTPPSADLEVLRGENSLSQFKHEILLQQKSMIDEEEKHHNKDVVFHRKSTTTRLVIKRSLIASRPDPEIVEALLAVGFISINACKRAALAVNNISAEIASAWLFENMEDPEIHTELIFCDSDDDDDNREMNNLLLNRNRSHSSSSSDECIVNSNTIISNNSSNISQIILSDEELQEIKEIDDFGMRGDEYFKHGLWSQAIDSYTKAIDDKNNVTLIYRLYCFRSECFRRLKQYPNAVSDTNAWMDMIFNDVDFQFVVGCEIASAIWIDLRRFNAAKLFIDKGINIDSNNELLCKRLKFVNKEIRKELRNISNDMDRKQLELNIDIENQGVMNIKYQLEKSSASIINDSCKEWIQNIVGNQHLTHKKCSKIFSSQTKKTKNIKCEHNCMCVQRLTFIMKLYSNWCRNALNNNNIHGLLSMYDILFLLHGYSIAQLMNDFIHLQQQTHMNMNMNECIIDDCHKFIRNHRHQNECDSNLNERAKMYFGFTESSDVIAIQMCDVIHCYMYHSMQCIMDIESVYDQIDVHDDDRLSSIVSFVTNQQRLYAKYINPQYVVKYVNTNSDQSSYNNNYWETDSTTFIPPKYNTFKSEIFSNNVLLVSEFEWEDILLKAKIYKKCNLINGWMANDENVWNDICHIRIQLPINISHVMVILFYVNNRYLYSQYHQHLCNAIGIQLSEIAHFSRLLQECIRFYGSFCDQKKTFYYILHSQKNITQYCLNFHSPTSVCLQLSAVMINNKENGTIVNLKSYDSRPMSLLDVSWISDSSFKESEYICNDIQFSICSICYKFQSYNIYIRSLKLFHIMIHGQFFKYNELHSECLDQQIIICCMKNMMNERTCSTMIPAFIQLLFEEQIKNTHELWMIKSQYLCLNEEMRNCLIIIHNNNNKYSFGSFLQFWKSMNLKAANFVHEYEWNISLMIDEEKSCTKKKSKQNFHSREFIGPSFIYPAIDHKTQLSFNLTVIPQCINGEFGIECQWNADECSLKNIFIDRIELQCDLFCETSDFLVSFRNWFTNQHLQTVRISNMHVSQQQDEVYFKIALRTIQIV